MTKTLNTLASLGTKTSETRRILPMAIGAQSLAFSHPNAHRVVLLDTNPSRRITLKVLLEAAGHPVLEVTSLAECRKALKLSKELPTAVLAEETRIPWYPEQDLDLFPLFRMSCEQMDSWSSTWPTVESDRGALLRHPFLRCVENFLEECGEAMAMPAHAA